MSFWTLRNLEKHVPAAAGARFSEIKLFAWGVQTRAQNGLNIDSKRPPEAPRWPKKCLGIDAPFSSKFQARIQRLLDLNMIPKINQKSVSTPQGSSEALSGSPGGSQEAVLEPSWAKVRNGPQEAPRRSFWSFLGQG